MSLRERVLRGGFYMALRQGLSVLIGVSGVTLLTRLIGPTNYGLYAGSFALLLFFALVGKMGVDVYLVRREDTMDETVYHQAFSFLLLSAIGLSSLGFMIAPALVPWMGDERFLAPLRVMLLLLPLTMLSAPATARIERALDYQKIAGIELMGQLLFYVLALVLAWRGAAVWAPVAGYGLWQAWMVGASYVLARYRPRWYWSLDLVKQMLSYGFGFSASVWIWHLRRLVNPFVVGSFLGPEGVGYVALTIRLVESLSFVKGATWRLSIAALAKVQRDVPRLRKGLEEAMGLQVLALGPLLAGFALAAPWLLPLLFGDRWDPVLLVFPFIALSYLVNAVFNMHASVLYVLKHNWAVTVFHVVHIVLFAGAALLLVDRVGLMGYGLAEVVGLGSYLIIHLQVARLFAFSYWRAWPWLLAFVPPLFFPLVGFPWALGLWIFAPVAGLSGSARAQVVEYWSYLRKSLERRGKE
jgi:PST family polysaccharide transporter